MISEEEIADEFPELFTYWHMTPDEYRDNVGKAVPPICLYGLQHSEGWNWLIEQLCAFLTSQGIETEITQIKEKHGALRFYTSNLAAPEQKEMRISMAQGAIVFAERLSRCICEECGLFVAENEGMYRTLCAACNAEGVERRRPDSMKNDDADMECIRCSAPVDSTHDTFYTFTEHESLEDEQDSEFDRFFTQNYVYCERCFWTITPAVRKESRSE